MPMEKADDGSGFGVCGNRRFTRYNRFKAGHPAGFIEAFANHYYDIADALLEFKKTGHCFSPWVFTAPLAKEGLEMLEALSKSARNHCWQKVSHANPKKLRD